MASSGFGESTERLRRCTVQVHTRGGQSTGSGVIWSADGSVITNAHVVRGPGALVQTWDGRKLEAAVVARDRRRDLARLRVGEALEPAVFRDSDQVRPGELVMAVGNPLGFVGALSTGVVHAVGPLSGLGQRRWIQADIRLAPGNSGGPLADAQGQVIGINTMVAYGLGLAIPSNSLGAFGRTASNPARLGVTVRPLPLLTSGRPGTGMLLLEVERGGPAEQAALMPGDLLIGANGEPFGSSEDLEDALERGLGSLRIQFLRGDRTAVRETVVRFESLVAEAA
jgi:serine protease Do